MKQPLSFFEIETDPFYVDDLRQMTMADRYLRWQFELVRPHLLGNVLEIGGGIGNFTPEVAGVVQTVTSIEPNRYCFEELKQRTSNLSNVRVLNISAEDLTIYLPSQFEFDVVLCMNVLEHIHDDRQALAVFCRHLRIGGQLVLQVPAVQVVYGEIDRRLGHYRRYSRTKLRQMLASLGYQVRVQRYFNTVGLIGWFWNAIITRKRAQVDRQIHFFNRYIVPWLSQLEERIHPPLGQCLLVVAERVSVVG